MNSQEARDYQRNQDHLDLDPEGFDADELMSEEEQAAFEESFNG